MLRCCAFEGSLMFSLFLEICFVVVYVALLCF